MKHVILAVGPAGVIAAETIRKHAPADDIVLVGDEPEEPYSRMAVPSLLIGQIAPSGTHLRHTPDHFAQLRIECYSGAAVRLDTAARQVLLADPSLLMEAYLACTHGQPQAARA